MKIHSIKLANQFNSLLPFDSVNFEHIPNPDGKIDPICLIGVNGSGKSNLLELIAEVFYYVELNHRFEGLKNSKTRSLKKVELIYSLKKNPNSLIKIDTISNTLAKLYTQKIGEVDWIEVSDSDSILSLLPTKIIGYTSGMNETLSFRLNQLDEEYSKNVRENARSKSKIAIPDNRMIFLDYESNESIVVSNYLFKSSKELKVFDDLLRINGLDSFRIIINLKRKGKSGANAYVILSKELNDNIQKLKQCSFCHLQNENEKYYEFDFLVNNSCRQAFKDHFGSVYNLFMVFQKLELLNSLNLEKKYRKTDSKDDLSDNKPTLAKEDKIFRFEEIMLNISKPKKTIPYIGISDGEHQFLQILGAIIIFDQDDVLFLLDEPETHFNPSWRTKFIHTLNEFTKGKDQEFVITTHSPFIVSDCKGYRVYKFIREMEKVYFCNIGIETFGTSFDVILKKGFDIEETISQEASISIKDLLTSNDAKKIQDFVDGSGPSFEKLALLKHLKELDTE